jgi:photosystem II stability/assembly factor-like uncharacterized protein
MLASKYAKTGHQVSMISMAMVASVTLLAACSSSESSTESNTETTQVVQAPDWGHVHNLSLVGDVVYLGTHNGFWKQEVDQEPILVSQPAFDVMGLAGSLDRWLASGHPGPEMDVPSNLGLIESVDGGVTWQSVSLSGEVDFHRAEAVGDFVLGLTAHSGSLLRSTDGGGTWSDLGVPSIFDFAINPVNPDVVFATSENGTLRSEDGGETFAPVKTPELLAFLAWGDQGLYAASTEGQILFTKDLGANWDLRGSLGAAPGALATDAGNVVAFVEDSIWGSTDEGLTFVKRVSGSGQH